MENGFKASLEFKKDTEQTLPKDQDELMTLFTESIEETKASHPTSTESRTHVNPNEFYVLIN